MAGSTPAQTITKSISLPILSSILSASCGSSDKNASSAPNFNDLWWSGVKIISSYAAAPADLQMALDLITYKRVNVAEMVTHNLPLAEIEKGFQMVSGGADSLKIIINPGI